MRAISRKPSLRCTGRVIAVPRVGMPIRLGVAVLRAGIVIDARTIVNARRRRTAPQVGLPHMCGIDRANSSFYIAFRFGRVRLPEVDSESLHDNEKFATPAPSLSSR